MKKLYRKSTVHPSLPVVSDHLSFLPAAIFTLAAALSQDDRRVLAYLLMSNNNNNTSCCHQRRPRTSFSFPATVASERRSSLGKTDHPSMFACDCFDCYMSYWVRWDSSPNRKLIHEIIDKFEDSLEKTNNNKGSKSKSNCKTKKERRKHTSRSKVLSSSSSSSSSSDDLKGPSSEHRPENDDSGSSMAQQSAEPFSSDGGMSTVEATSTEAASKGSEKGLVKRLVSFIGERIWGV